MNFPHTAQDLYQWNAALLIGYCLVGAALDGVYRQARGLHRRDSRRGEWRGERLFDGATFSTSATVLMGIFDPAVLHLVGDTTAYLSLAAAAGLIYSVRALYPRT